MEWDFAHCSLTSERRPLLEIRGAAHARIFRCSLAGLNIQGEVNRATDAILLRALPAASARDAAGALGQGLDELPAGDELPGGVPRVDVNCSVVQHCECALRVLPLTAGPSQHRRPVQVEAHLVNSVLEDNKLALALTCRSLVTPFPSAPLSRPRVPLLPCGCTSCLVPPLLVPPLPPLPLAWRSWRLAALVTKLS